MAERRQNMLKVNRSTRFPRIYHEKLGPATCPYLERWVADFGLFSLRLHYWLHSDDMRAYHDHAWWLLSLCLRGCLVDVSAEGEDTISPGSLRFRRAEHRHAVRVVRPAWTLLLTGPERRVWGFWPNGKFRKRNKYFYEHGHHDPQVPTMRWQDGSV